MSPRPAAYYVASTLHAAPDSSPIPLRTHALVSLLIGLALWSVTEQRWPIAVGIMTLIAVVAMFRARRRHGSHLPPSRFLVAGMVVALSLPFTIFLLDLPGLPVGIFVVGTTVVLAAMRMDEKKRRHRLATGDFNYRDLW